MGNEDNNQCAELVPSVNPADRNALNPSGSGGRAYLTTVAHELKTPLAVISGYIQLLLDGNLGALNSEQKQVLDDAWANCARLKKFVGEFLSHAALEAAKPMVRLERGDLNQCLADLCCYWQQQVQAKSVALYFNPDAGINSFWFDYDKIQHIVSNLLDNALKFTPSGGTIWLTTHLGRLDKQPHGEAQTGGTIGVDMSSVPAVKVVVADTGPGIPAEFHTEVFSEFYKIPNQKGNPFGTGLGLSIAKRLTQMHGGRIWIECEPGAGTRVCFLIPLQREPQEAESKESGQ